MPVTMMLLMRANAAALQSARCVPPSFRALGLGGSTNPSSPMYETLAPGVADRTPTTQDLNIPDPPEGADPQMAAGFRSGSTPPALAPNGFAAALGPGSSPGPAGLMPLSSTAMGAMATSFSTGLTAQQPASTMAQHAVTFLMDSGPSLIVLGIDREVEHGLLPPKSRAGLLFDSVLDELAADSIPAPGQEAAEDAGNHAKKDETLPDAPWLAPVTTELRSQQPAAATAQPAIHRQAGSEHAIVRQRTNRAPDSVLDELASNAVLLGKPTEAGAIGIWTLPGAGMADAPVLGDPIVRGTSVPPGPATPREPGSSPARLAAILLAAGLGGYAAATLTPRNPIARSLPHKRRWLEQVLRKGGRSRDSTTRPVRCTWR